MNVTENDEKHSLIWGMFMSVTLEAAVSMEENYSDNWHSSKNTKDLTMKQMFDVSAKLVSEQDEISGVKTNWLEKIVHGSICLGLVMNKSSAFSAQRSTSFQILYCVLVGYTRTPNQTLHGNKDRVGSSHFRNTETLTELTASQWNSSGIFPRIQYVAAQWRSPKFTVEIKWNTRESYRKDHLHVDVQRDLLWIKWQWKRMRVKCPTRFSFCKKIWNRTMVIFWSWIKKKVVFHKWR